MPSTLLIKEVGYSAIIVVPAVLGLWRGSGSEVSSQVAVLHALRGYNVHSRHMHNS